MTSLVTQLVNSRAPEIAIYLRTYLRTSFRRKTTYARVSYWSLHEQTRIAATRLVLTAVILNSIEDSGPISNGRTHKMYSEAVHVKSFGRANPLEPPLPTGLYWILQCLQMGDI